MRRKSLAILVALMLMLSILPMTAMATFTTATIKGVNVANLGTSDADIEDAVAGAVTLTEAQAEGDGATAFESTLWTGDITIKRVADATGAAWTAASAWDNNEDVEDGDIFAIEVDTDDAGTLIYFVVVVTVSSGGGSSTGDPTGNSTVGGDGDAEYINTRIFSVTLPTGKLLDFTLDPQGLLKIQDGQSVKFEDLGGGAIVSTGDAKVINNSSLPVTVDIDLTGVGSGATWIPFTDDTEKTIEAVNNGTGRNILLYAVPASANIGSSSADYVAADRGFIIGTSVSTLRFVLGSAQYQVTNTGGTLTSGIVANTSKGTAIQLGGLVNDKANWEDFAGATPSQTLSITAVFKYAEATSQEVTSAATPVGGILGMISPAVTNSIELAPPLTTGFGVAGSLTQNYTVTRPDSGGASVPFVLDGNDVESAVWTVSGNSVFGVAGGGVTISGGFINIPAGVFAWNEAYDILITLSNGNKHTLSIPAP